MSNKVDGTKWNDYLIGAMRAFRLNDLDLAEKRLDKAFAAGGPSIPILHLLAGHIAHARNALIEAEKSWRRVLEIDEDNAEAWNNLGVLYRRRGDIDTALDAFQEARQRAPDRPDIPYNIGNLQKSAGRTDEAIAAYNQSIEIDPGYAPAYNNLGTIYESRKQRDRAMEVFRRGLSADSGDASIRFNMGLVYQETERWEDARESFDSALKSRPGWVPGLNNLGIVLQETGREEEAARTFRTLLDIEPDNTSALNNLGVAYARLGRKEDARACFRKALNTEPDYIKAALNLHDSYHESQELNEALQELNKQITHHPTDPDIRVRMARTLMGLTRWDEAELSLNHVLERDPSNTAALRTKAELYLAMKRPEEAEKLLKQLPHDPGAVRDLAQLYASTGRTENAEQLLGELIAVDPDDSESRRLLAGLIAEERPDEALRLTEEAASTEPGQTSDMVSLAELYDRTGQKDMALGKLDEAVSLLGMRGEAEDLDQMNAVLGLYEKAAAALEEEHSTLFAERTAQLGRKLQSAVGRQGAEWSRSGQFAMEEIPLDEEDALSLLDINAMEPIIRINEEEETVFLEDAVENLEDAWTELQDREEEPDYRKGRLSPGLTGGAPAGAPATPSAGSDSGGQQAGGPPVHIHLPPQSSIPAQPQVIYQDIRPVTQASPQPAPDVPSPIPDESTEITVEEIDEELLPELEEETD
ncbi:MAG: tetratricopeptide repeat protein, partial [Spirochaetaceae bacterium]|nr:tetratricopeptide repeat protein [Spirochaetaceae bacterium]